MVQTIQNTFLIENDKISVIRYSQDKRVEFIKKDGEKQFEIEADFWEWWQRVTSYIEGDKLNYCILYDKENSLFEDDFFLNLEKESGTIWNSESIDVILKECREEYEHICVHMADGTDYRIDRKDIMYKNDIVHEFYTNIIDSSIQEKSVEIKVAEEKEEVLHSADTAKSTVKILDIDEAEVAPFAKYFMDNELQKKHDREKL